MPHPTCSSAWFQACTALWLFACDHVPTATVSLEAGPVRVEETHLAYQGLGMNTGEADIVGKPERAPCGSCHHLVGPREENEFALELREFHRGVDLQHGDNTCRTCHAPPDFGSFQLASGRKVEHADAMQLCAQCHAGQWGDYQLGMHGGMTGYWDLTQGPRLRNSCLDCHAAHAPAILSVMPAPRPRPRFLTSPGAAHE